MSETTNYKFPLYDSTDKPNLRDQYNGAMNMLDEELNSQSLNLTKAMSDINSLETGLEDANTAIDGKAPIAHASEETTYGVGSANKYGHVKLSDSGNSDASEGAAATPKLVSDSIASATSPGKLLCIGDSYARMEDASQISWCTYLKNNIGYSDLNTYAEGGSGFVTAGISGHTFPQLAEQAIANIEDKDAYTMVVVAGGRNDSLSTTYSTYYNAVYTMLTRLKTAFTNARVIVVPMLWHNVRNYERGLWTLAGACIDAATSANCEAVNWAWTWGLGRDSLYDGGIHPISAGGQMIASYITEAINGSYSGRILTAKISDFGTGDCTVIGVGGIMTVLVGGTWNNETGTLPNAFKCVNLGSCWSVIYANGGSDTAVLQLGTNITIYGGGNKGNVGGTFTMPW